MDGERVLPPGFLVGTATSAHQVEGGNWNNDWWAWEHAPGTPCAEPSGDARDHYHRYPEDIRLLAELGFDHYRFSLEWSRIEPEEGEWSRAALDHYRRMCAACLEAGLVPMVTLHHFTTPRWLAAKGGWERPETADAFARFSDRVAAHLADVVGWVCTINEPNIVAFMGWVFGMFPPGASDEARAEQAHDVLVAAHRKAVDAVKAHLPGSVPVGLTLSMQELVAVEGGEKFVEETRRTMEDRYLDAARGDDFLGVQTYTRQRFGRAGMLGPEDGVAVTQMGWEVWPDALEACIRRAWDATGHTPILVTENGIAVADDAARVDYVRRALDGVLRCADDGIDVRGYTYWSAFDNFEWTFGYAPTFGIVAVDRDTQVRAPKPSARWLGEVARRKLLVAP